MQVKQLLVQVYLLIAEPRAENNIAGVYLVERAVDGGTFEIVDRIFAGRMPLGVQPAQLDADGNIVFFREDGSPDTMTAARLSPMVRMYLEFGRELML